MVLGYSVAKADFDVSETFSAPFLSFLPSFHPSFLFTAPPAHMEVPRLGVELALQLPACTTATATPDPNCICDLCRSLWQCQILNPLSEARDQTASSRTLGCVLNPLSHNGSSCCYCFFFFYNSFHISREQNYNHYFSNLDLQSPIPPTFHSCHCFRWVVTSIWLTCIIFC